MGKPLDIFEINSKISHKNYVVISIKLVELSEINELNNLLTRDHIVPLLYKRDLKSRALIYRKGMNLVKGGEIILIDFDPTLTDLSASSFLLADFQRDLAPPTRFRLLCRLDK